MKFIMISSIFKGNENVKYNKLTQKKYFKESLINHKVCLFISEGVTFKKKKLMKIVNIFE